MRLSALLLAASAALSPTALHSSPYLYAWANEIEGRQRSFLAVVDANPASKTYGQIVGTGITGAKADAAHHTEYEMGPGDTLFANDWGTGETFVITLSDPRKPAVVARFMHAGKFIFPHSFARLPNGNVLATFQSIGDKYAPPGGVAELDNQGRLVRAVRSETPDIPNAINWPYSVAVIPGTGRAVVTSTDMGRGKDWKSPDTNHIQIYSIDDLKLRASVALPPAPGPAGKKHIFPAEPRVLADGSVLVNTFSCGLYQIEGLTGDAPRARFVHAFDGGMEGHDMCAVPVVYGKYWIQTTGANNGLVVLDVADPARPREVSRFSLPHSFHMPHWISANRTAGRVAVTGSNGGWIAMLKFDEATGALSLDPAFGKAGVVDLTQAAIPNGIKGKINVHGTVFSR